MANVANENGISKKIRSQAAVWSQLGHSVRYFSLTPTINVWDEIAPLETDLTARGGLLERGARSRHMANRVRAWNADLIYFRYAYYSPGLPSLFRKIPTVAEINSDDLREYPLTLSWPKLMYHRLWRNTILRELASFVTVTHELKLRFRSFNKPIQVIGNGIDLAAIDPSVVLNAAAPKRLIFVGNTGSPWHGLDRVGEIVRLLPEYSVDVVGCTNTDWRKAVGPVLVPPQITFHGMLPRSAYEPLLHRATAAIGTLGLFQKGMDEACPLKVREYLAFGLPVIGAYNDTDFPSDADYFLQLPNSAAPLDSYKEKLRSFLNGWRERRVPRSSIAHLDTNVKERERLTFMMRFARAHEM
jgi:glycosyltransferase involved in cell wall biosynthesis